MGSASSTDGSVHLHAPSNSTAERLADGDGKVLDHTTGAMVVALTDAVSKDAAGIGGVVAAAVASLQAAIATNVTATSGASEAAVSAYPAGEMEVLRSQLAQRPLTDDDLAAFFGVIIHPALGTHDIVLHISHLDASGNYIKTAKDEAAATATAKHAVDSHVLVGSHASHTIFASAGILTPLAVAAVGAAFAANDCLRELWSEDFHAAFTNAFTSTANACRAVYDSSPESSDPESLLSASVKGVQESLGETGGSRCNSGNNSGKAPRGHVGFKTSE